MSPRSPLSPRFSPPPIRNAALKSMFPQVVFTPLQVHVHTLRCIVVHCGAILNVPACIYKTIRLMANTYWAIHVFGFVGAVRNQAAVSLYLTWLYMYVLCTCTCTCTYTVLHVYITFIIHVHVYMDCTILRVPALQDVGKGEDSGVVTKTMFSGNLASSRKCVECGQLNSKMAKKCLQCRSPLQVHEQLSRVRDILGSNPARGSSVFFENH